MTTTLVLVLAVLAGCGAEQPATPEPGQGMNQRLAGDLTASKDRLPWTEACPRIGPHLVTTQDFVTEFVEDAQALADRQAETRHRLDLIIADLDRDRMVAPEPLVPHLTVVIDTMRGLRDYYEVGGERYTHLEPYRQASFDIILTCGEHLP